MPAYGSGSAPEEARDEVGSAGEWISGLVFAILLIVALILVREEPGLNASDQAYVDFYANGHGNTLVTFGLYIVPFAGIAFMWHMATIRTLLDDVLSRSTSVIHRWLQLGSGLIFVCMIFAASAAVGAIALISVFSSAELPPPDVERALNGVGYGLVFVFGVRAAGMFMVATTTLARRANVMRTWLAVVSYLAAAFLLLSATFHLAILLVFPAWTVLISVLLLIRSRTLSDDIPLPPNTRSSPVEGVTR